MRASVCRKSLRHVARTRNDRDKFLWPADTWMSDREFQLDCLIFTLFHGQNRISCWSTETKTGSAPTGHPVNPDNPAILSKNTIPNHWIPFFEAECIASREIGSRAEGEEGNDLRPVSTSDAKQTPLPLRSAEAPRFFQSLASEPSAPPELLVTESSAALVGDLCAAMKALAARIAPKVRQHGFLR